MKNKHFLRFLSFVFFMMVSGISFAMDKNLPIVSMASKNGQVAILRYSAMNEKQQVGILDLEKETYKILHNVAAINDKTTGIVFDENGKVRLKNVSEEKYGLRQGKGYFCRIYDKVNNKYWSELVWLNAGTIFAVSPDERYVAALDQLTKMVVTYLPGTVQIQTAVNNLNRREAVTALTFKDNNTLLVSYNNNSIEEATFTIRGETLSENRHLRKTYDLNTFNDINMKHVFGWTWASPKMRIVMFSGTCLTVAFLLYYTQYFSRMPA